MKKLAIVLLVLVSMVFARQRAESWIIKNVNVSGNVGIVAPYLNSGLAIKSFGPTCNLYANTGVANSLNFYTVSTGADPDINDLYPLNFVGGRVVTLNAKTTANVQYIWYDNKE